MDFSPEETIKQLGGKRFIVMTGAKNFVKGKNSISFALPKAQNQIKYVKITLTEMDTYTMEFLSSSGKVIKKEENVYNDQLQVIFRSATGLYTHL